MESSLRRIIKFTGISLILCGIIGIAFFLQTAGILANFSYYFGNIENGSPRDARVVYAEGIASEPLGFFGKISASFFGDSRTARVDVIARVGDAVEVHGETVVIYRGDKEVARIASGGEPATLSYRVPYEAVLRREADGVLAKREERIAFEVEHPRATLLFTLEPLSGITKFEPDGQGGVRILERTLQISEIKTGADLPTGDAIASMTSVLRYLGLDAKKNALAAHLKTEDFYYQNNLLFGADPELAFAGKPTDPQGWFVYEKPVLQATRDYLRTLGKSEVRVEAMEHPTKEAMIEAIRRGSPLVIWQTDDLAPARFDYRWHLITTGDEFLAPVNLVVTALHGYDATTFFVMNPDEGFQQVDQELLMRSIESLGSRVIRVIP